MIKTMSKRFGLFLFVFFIGTTAAPAQAAEKFCSDYDGVIDGNVLATSPGQITIDRDCTFQNWTEPNPLDTTVNFQTNDPTIYLIVFDNVDFTGHMACASVDHRIWFSNGSDYGSSNSCQDLFIPVETIHKQSPSTTAAIGVPFTYTLTLPSMDWPAGEPSNNDLHTVTLWDDLSATGVDLTYVDINAYYKSSGETITLEKENDPNAKGGVWTPRNLSYKPIPLIDAGDQVVVEITVVLDDTTTNLEGMSFTNTAKWWFGRIIDDTFYEPLPGEWGISQPMTIGEPDLVVTKATDETALNLGIPVIYTIDVQNTGGSDARNVTVIDQIPDSPDAGMCDYDPRTDLDVRIVDATGSPVSDLIPGTDYSATYNECNLGLDMLTDKAAIAPDQHLIITYQSQLDTDTTVDGLELVNVAGVTEWFSAGDYSGRKYTRTLSDGTPDIVDHQDSQSVTTALSGYYFQKTAENLTSGEAPATVAAPGDRLRYKLRLFNVDQTIEEIAISDSLDLNSFEPNTFDVVSLPEGAIHEFDAATGLLRIHGEPTPLDVAIGEELVIEFEINLKANLANGTEVPNQASLSAGPLSADSDDPYVNGIAGPDDPADPTTVEIQTPGPLSKTNTQTSATIGEQFKYLITVPATPVDVPLYDVKILDDLTESDVQMRFVGAEVVSGENWALTNTGGSGTDLVIEDTVTGIDIPANEQTVIEMTVEQLNTSINSSGLSFNNRASYIYNRSNGDDGTQAIGQGNITGDMSVVEPQLSAVKRVNFVEPADKKPTDPATVGDVLEYVVTISNSGESTAFDTNVVDTLPESLSLVADSATAQIDGVDVSGFIVNPATMSAGALAWGRQNGDETLDIPAGQTLILTYRVTVESVVGADINNSVYLDWTSLNGANTAERTGEGCPDITAPNDYCSGPATVAVGTLDNTSIAKSVVDDSFAETPSSSAHPIVRVGDTVTYDLTLNLQEYTTGNVIVEDALPEGMAVESFSITGASSFDYTLLEQPAPGDTDALLWDFGDISNPPSNDGTPSDVLNIRYVAKVVADPSPAGVVNDSSILLDNLAKLSYAGGDPDAFPERLTATETIEIRQPQMRAINKVDAGNGRVGTGTTADPYQVDLATDEMTFRVSSCNDGLAPAYGVVIADLLAPEFDENGLSSNPPVVKIGTEVLSEGSDYTYIPPERGGEMRIELLDDTSVNPDECVTVDYNIGFHTDLTVSKSWSNEARLPEYWSLPLSETGRLYSLVDPAQVWMTNLVSDEQLLKTLTGPTEATIGDEVVYRITVPAVPMNTALDEVAVTDTLHGALEYVGSSAVDGSGSEVVLTDNTEMPGKVKLGAGHIAAGEQVIITLRARVANNDEANAGVTFTNTASYTYAGMPDGLNTASTSGPLTIVEPLVRVQKDVSETSPGAGDILTYTLTFAAEGSGEGDNYSSAFDLAIEDTMGPGLAYLSGSATVNGEALSDPVITGDGVSEPQILSWTPANGNDIDIAEGTETTVVYQARVMDDVSPGQSLTSSVVGRWTGLDGNRGDIERTGSGTPLVNDYVTQPAVQTLTSRLAVSFGKSVVNTTTGEDPGENAQPGDTLRYTLVLSNESVVPLENASVVDELAAQFAPGSLKILSISDPNADSTQSDAWGGAGGTGLVDIRNLTLGAQGDPDDTLTIEFEATLAPVIQSGTEVLNQAQLTADNLNSSTSNETSTLIKSSPEFEVWKTSRDISGDPNELMAGDTLRYTITVKNTGSENAIDTLLRDDIPANTTYVAGSTTLNGNIVPDPSSGTSPLRDGLSLNAPGDTSSGTMRADSDPDSSNEATVTFDVVIDPTVMDGLVIANQGILSASGSGSGPLPERPSDDPGTPILLDPTRDIVGNMPLLRARKTVQIHDDSGTEGIVDPGDVLRYTIEIYNFGAVPATQVVLTDLVPADTAYVADSLRLNGTSLDSDGGVSPLTAGLPVQSSDQPGDGIVSVDSTALVTFDVRVDDGVPSETLISNQGTVTSNELPSELTDADGIPSNGYQPTVVVVGAAQLLSVTKDVSVVGGGNAEAGSQLEYMIRVTNIGSLPGTNVVLTDDLAPLLGQVAYIADSCLLDGASTGVMYANSMLTADYSSTYGELSPGAAAELRFRVQIDPLAEVGTTITNTGFVRWSDPAQSDSASVSLDIGGTPGSAALNGSVWHDADLDKSKNGSERLLEGWSVDLYGGDRILTSTLSDASGDYRLSGLLPNEGDGEPYELRFRAPGSGPNTPSLGNTDSPFSDGPQQISKITLASGGNIQSVNLPITPNGAVYDSVQRTPVPGARLTMLKAATDAPLPSRCFDDPAQQNQSTPNDGFYKFDLAFGDDSCQPGDTYFIEVTPPSTGYVAPPSRIIPPNGEPIAPFSVPDCPGSDGDAVPTTGDYCEVTASAAVPPLSALPRTDDTVYHLYLTLGDGLIPGESQAFNNHIPIDPELDGAVAISKTSSSINVNKGELVPYTITVENIFGVPLQDIGIVDRFPPGFKYVEGSAQLDGEPSEPGVEGTQLLWDGLELQVNEKRTIKLLLVVGAGVSEGEYVNRAQVISTASGGAASGEAAATVRVVSDPTFDCTDIVGKIFDDRNLNGQQDDGEEGLAGSRVVTARGLVATADEHGRFHIACAMVPDEDRGSNFILKLDDRSLPTGYRVTTENPRVQRATRGKMMKFNFGATIHRVVGIDIADGVFEPDSTRLRLQWRRKMDQLMEVLKTSPAVLRLSYLADVEGEHLVRKRLKSLKKEIDERWEHSGGGYRLTIETEVFWRRGGPM